MASIDYMAAIGSEIRERRKALGITQQTVAELAGVSRRLVSEIERGRPTVRVDVLGRVVGVLGLELGVT